MDRINGILEGSGIPLRVDKGKKEERAAAVEAWFAWQHDDFKKDDRITDGVQNESKKATTALCDCSNGDGDDKKGNGASKEMEVRVQVSVLAEMIEKNLDKRRKRKRGRPKGTTRDVLRERYSQSKNNNSSAADEKKKEKKKGASNNNENISRSSVEKPPGGAITHTADGKKKITIRFVPESEVISEAIKATGNNPFVDLTFRTKKKLGEICDHFATKWSEAAATLEEVARKNETNLKKKTFMFTLRPNFGAAGNTLSLNSGEEPCVVWDKQIMGDLTALEAYESRGYPEIFKIKYSWRFVSLPPPEKSDDTVAAKKAKKRPPKNEQQQHKRTKKEDFSKVFEDSKTRTPLPPPDFTMSAFDFKSMYVNNEKGAGADAAALQNTKKKMKKTATNRASEKKMGNVKKKEESVSDAEMARQLNAEINGGNRKRSHLKPSSTETNEENEEYGNESDLESKKEEKVPLRASATPEKKEIEQFLDVSQWFDGTGFTNTAPSEATMNGLREFLASGKKEEKGPSNFAGLKF